MMVTYIELPYLFTVTHSFFLHGFNNHLLEFTCVFLVRYPFRHIKSPHLLTVYHMSDKWVADHIRGALSVVLTGQPFLSCPVLFSGLMQQPLCSSLIQSSAGPRPSSRNGGCLCPSQPLGGTAVSRSGNSFRTMVFLTRQDNPRLTPYRKQEPGR